MAQALSYLAAHYPLKRLRVCMAIPKERGQSGSSAQRFVIGSISSFIGEIVRLQHGISLYEMAYRNLKKSEATGRIEEFIFRYLKFHHNATSHF
jgi:hypothetical protein